MFKIVSAVVALASINDIAEAINVRINKIRDEEELDCYDECDGSDHFEDCVVECQNGEPRDIRFSFVQIKQDTTFDLATTKLADHCHEFEKPKDCKNWCSSQYKVKGDNDSRPREDCKVFGCPYLCGL